MRPDRFTSRLRTVAIAGLAALVAGAGSATDGAGFNLVSEC